LVDCQVMDYSLLVGIVYMDIHKKHESIRQAAQSIKEQDRILQRLEHTPRRKLDSKAIFMLTTPVRLLLSPPLYLVRKAWNLTRRGLDSIITLPMPYYGSGACGVDGGKLSVFHGKRRGDRAVYYMGLIDFLQPWTVRKVLERQLKAFLGYDTKAISSVTPEEYASRFLDYLDANIT
jgi:Phosphatidylinositol-4-phosphate 5-Kinase